MLGVPRETVQALQEGDPGVNQCGEVLGISRIGLAGLSLFIHAPDAKALVPSFTDEGIEKVEKITQTAGRDLHNQVSQNP